MKDRPSKLTAAAPALHVCPDGSAAAERSLICAHRLAVSLDGAPFTDYFLECGNLLGTVVPFSFWDNGDGTWSFVTDGQTRILVDCICEQHYAVIGTNPQGQPIRQLTSYKVNFTVQPADAPSTPGISLRHFGTELEDDTFRQRFYQGPYVLEVFFGGQRLDDFSVTSDTPAVCAVDRQSDGTLVIQKRGNGMGSFTVTWGDKCAVFQVDLT